MIYSMDDLAHYAVRRSEKLNGEWREAVFSNDMRYRYLLNIAFTQDPKSWVNFVMLNPSTADENKNDPTVARCIKRAKLWGYEGLIVTNCYAVRSPDPGMIDPAANAEDDNPEWIRRAAMHSNMVIAAWGASGPSTGKTIARTTLRGVITHRSVMQERIRFGGVCHLGLSHGGEPRHPLYVPYSQQPESFNGQL